MIIEYLQERVHDLVQYFDAQFTSVYEAQCLKWETEIRVTKIAVSKRYKSTVDIVLTGFHKIGSNLVRLLCTQEIVDIQPLQDSDLEPSRINFDHFSPVGRDESEKESHDPFAAFSERKRLEHEAQQQEANPYACQSRLLLKHGRGRGSSHQRCPSPPPPAPKPSYMSTLPPRDPRRDPAKQLEFVREKLSCMVSKERMNLGVGHPSGHTGIDPVIAAHNQLRILAHINEHKAAVRQAAAEHERQQAQEAKAREETELRVQVAREQYVRHVECLVAFADQMNDAINQLEAETKIAMEMNDCSKLARLAQDICLHVFAPIVQHFNHMADSIPLEEQGAQYLREKWPCERLEQICTFSQNVSGLPAEIISLRLAIQTISEPLRNPIPFVHPLEVKPVQQSGFSMGAAPTNHTISGALLGAPVFAPAAVQNITTSETPSGPNFSSFSALVAAAKPAAQSSINTSVLAGAAAPTGAPVFANAGSSGTSAGSSTAAGNPFQKTTHPSISAGTTTIPQNNTATNNAIAASSSSPSSSQLPPNTLPPPSSAPTLKIQPPTPTFNGTEAGELNIFFSTFRSRAPALLERARLTLVSRDTGSIRRSTRTNVMDALKEAAKAANGQQGLFAASHEPKIKECVVGIRKLLVGMEQSVMEKRENKALEKMLDAVIAVWRGETVGMFV